MSSKEILGEYTKVAVKLEHINASLQEMNAVDVAQLIDKIRTVERKMGLVYTLFKSSVYSVSKQNQDQEEDEADQNQQAAQDQEEQEQEQESEPQYNSNNMQYNLGQQNAQGYQGQEHQEYHEQGYQHQQQRSSQPYQEYAQQRSSIYPSHETSANKQGSYYSGINRQPQSQGSAAREEYPASTGGAGGGDRALLSLSRGYSGTRWTHTGRRDTESHTNRPRFY
ncbi:hypothetical protein BGZ67_007690 [Mortierella alpina]|nr:hypothetical protein BGZ67_007690 [Mortierella alpina]